MRSSRNDGQEAVLLTAIVLFDMLVSTAVLLILPVFLSGVVGITVLFLGTAMFSAVLTVLFVGLLNWLREEAPFGALFRNPSSPVASRERTPLIRKHPVRIIGLFLCFATYAVAIILTPSYALKGALIAAGLATWACLYFDAAHWHRRTVTGMLLGLAVQQYGFRAIASAQASDPKNSGFLFAFVELTNQNSNLLILGTIMLAALIYCVGELKMPR